MKKSFSIHVLALAFVFQTLSISCNNNIIDEPSVQKLTTGGSTTTLSVPSDVTATQGDFESVTISWTGCNAASRYFVYSAESSFDTFVQRGETKGNATSLTLTEPAGTTKYYKVSSVRYDGTESSLSKWAKGTTISKPIITSITKDDDNNACTVTWWMENCNSKTYLSSVRYSVEGRKGTETKASIKQEIKGSDGIDSWTFTGLEGKTDYAWKVCAYTVSESDGKEVSSKAEESSELTITTAHRLIPLPPVDLTATQGKSKTSVSVDWKMPEKTDIENDDGTFTETDNFFAVYKKLSSSSDSSWTIVKVYAKNGGTRTINGTDYTTESFSEYTAGTALNFTDTMEENSNYGVKYDYKVKVFVDATSAKTSGVSETTATGWLVSKPSLSVSASYSRDPSDDSKFASASLTFSPSFNTLLLDDSYSYVLVESRNDLETDKIEQSGWPMIIGKSNSIVTCCASKTFTDMSVKGYYRYTLYILPRVSSDADYDSYLSTNIISVQADGKITITDDTNAIPDLDSVTIEDGYKDCFKLKWKYDENCNYILTWTTGDGKSGKYTLSATDVTGAVNGTDFTFTHKGGTDSENDPAIVSGEKRLYTLTADKGITKSVTAESFAETLGTASPSMTDNDYKTISVRWPKVQKATSYELSATVNNSSWTFTKSDETTEEIDGVTYVEYTLTDGGNYKDAKLSGLPISLSVKAKSSTDDETEALASVCTIGPAKTEPSVNGINKEYIEFTWKKAEGAKGYLVHRGIKLYNGSSWQDSTNYISYYISSDCSTIEAGGESRSSDCVEVTYNASTETYTLKDKYHESTSDTPGAYDFSQAAIAWGVPFTYYVVPLKNGTSDMTINTSNDTHTIGIKGDAAYSNLTESKGSTYGYGQNVIASKCESDSQITLTWEKPYDVKFAPNIYYRKAGSTDNSWNRITKATPAKTDTSITIDFDSYFSSLSDYTSESKYKAYEYAVAYYTTQQTGYEIPSSFVNNSDNGGLAAVVDNEDTIKLYNGRSPEKKNKGYLLTVDGFSACYAGSSSNLYCEKVIWNDWDYTERGIGPEKYTIYMKNKNLIKSDFKDPSNVTGWVKLATLGSDARVTSNFDAEKTSALENDLVLSSDLSQLIISSQSLANGATTTNGMLKVLRDGKHYYEIVATVGECNGSTGHNENVYAYRQLTDEELAKAAMLALSYGFYINDGGKPDYSNVADQMKYGGKGSQTTTFTDSDGNQKSGTASFDDREAYSLLSSYSGKYHAGYSLVNYAPSQKCPDGTFQTFMCLTKTDSNGFRIKGNADNYLYQFADTQVITVTGQNIPEMPDYSASISFTASDKDTLKITITRNGKTTTLVDTTDNTTRKNWFPMQIHSDKGYELDSTTYGWWPTN